LAQEAGWHVAARDWRQAARRWADPRRKARAGLIKADKWQQTILWEFPENYKLYEHIKTKADGQAKTVKNHSGGGHDRQDAYLYGYPKGPRKRYRSPADFFPHLLWLCTDENSDYQNCTCKMCSPVQLEVEKPAVKTEIKSEPSVTVMKREPSQGAATQAPIVSRNPVVVVPPPARRSVSGPPTQSPSMKLATPASMPTHAPNPQQIRAPAPLQSTPLPQPRGGEQLTDSRYGQFLCRTGEVVWFFRPKTAAWGLGLVLRRWVVKEGTSSKAYLVQPLSHPFDSATPEVVTTDQHLKPWLAWSAPACTYPYLQQNPQLRYDQVDWNALLSGRFGEGVPDVDASIMAAKAIDTTYTLSERIKTTPVPGGEERHYNCIYLGAEKIWRGDPVRLRLGQTGTDLLVITDIIERLNTSTPQPTSQIWMTGDMYSYATLPAPETSNLPSPPSSGNTNIPIRMREDMAWRNRILVPMTQTLGWWRLIASSSSTKIDVQDVKGRWYESSLLFEESFTKAVKNGEGGDGIWMNARGDATGVGRSVGTSRPDRIAAFGNALPKGTRLVEGVEAPMNGEVPTGALQGLDIGVGTGTAADPFSIDDFMNVEGLEDGHGVDFSAGFQF
jgi:hypothetical protein